MNLEHLNLLSLTALIFRISDRWSKRLMRHEAAVARDLPYKERREKSAHLPIEKIESCVAALQNLTSGTLLSEAAKERGAGASAGTASDTTE
jgi:hypothetical protein